MRRKPSSRSSMPPQLAVQMEKILETAPSTSGKRFLLKHIQGDVLTRAQAIKAKCCDCMGYFSDGRADCGMPACALYPFMPYRSEEDTHG